MVKKKRTGLTKHVSSSPVRRRAKRTLKARSRKRRGMSEMSLPLIGNIGLHNPLIGGTVGGVVGAAIKNNVPDIELSTGMAGLQPYIKGLFLAGAALLAKQAKQPEIAAGLMGAATVYVLNNLQVKGLSGKAAVNQSRGMKRAQYADVNLLSAGNIYPGPPLQDAMMLSDTQLLSNRY